MIQQVPVSQKPGAASPFPDFDRVFDRNAISAGFAKGVLTLEIAKTAAAPFHGKRIEVKPA